jgi:transaldolase
MKIFLDTANLDEIKQAQKIGLVDGVTTNPTLLAKEKKPFKQAVKEICGIVDGPVSAEVIGETAGKMIDEANDLVKIASNVVIKIPMSQEGLKAAHELEKQKIKTNVTLCFSPNQALLAAKANASYVSVFVGRLDDAGHNGMDIIRQIKTIFFNYKFSSRLIVASIRHPVHVVETALTGADIATIPYTIYEKMFRHPLTESGIQTFLKDWAKVPK